MKMFGLTLVDFLAIYGAVVSTISIILGIVLAVRELSRDRRRVKVICTVGNYGSWVMGVAATLELLIIEAINTGHRPITITAAGFQSGKRQFCVMDEEFDEAGSLEAQTIADGEKATVYSSETDLLDSCFKQISALELRKCRAFVRDAEGNEYSAPLPQEWITRFIK